jgi:hypothetical protein
MASKPYKPRTATAKVETPDPSIKSSAYQQMVECWHVIDTLIAGTAAMKAAGELYLPKHDAETEARYAQRLNGNFLHNGTAAALANTVSGPFSEPVVLSEDMPDSIRNLMDNIDLQGNNIDVFARQWFEKSVAKAFCHVLVDFPRVAPVPTGVIRTLADDNKAALRPYMTIVAPENLFFAYAEDVNGVETLKQVRIMEEVVSLDGFKEVCTKQIRVYMPGMVEIYREFEITKDKTEWRRVDGYEMSLTEIPIVTCYMDKAGLMVGKPPLTDTADMNVRHWQSNSDQIIALTASRFPMLAFIGLEEDATNETTIGPYQAFKMSNPQGKIEYIQHNGSAIAAGQAELLSLEQRMGEAASKLLQKPNATATSHIISAESANSPVQDMVVRFEDAFASALRLMGLWLKIPDGETVGTINVNRNFGIGTSDRADLPTLDKARDRKDLSRESYLTELVVRGVLNEDFDLEENQTQLDDEAMSMPDPVALTDLNPLDTSQPVIPNL